MKEQLFYVYEFSFYKNVKKPNRRKRKRKIKNVK